MQGRCSASTRFRVGIISVPMLAVETVGKQAARRWPCSRLPAAMPRTGRYAEAPGYSTMASSNRLTQRDRRWRS